jgi:hypothetical protein
MNEFFDKTKQELRAKKEFVYQQWRKELCFPVVNTDISDNENQPVNITSEQIRAVFDYGYKMAMLQTKDSLLGELYESTNLREKQVIEQLLGEVEDRLETSKCIVTFSKETDKALLNYAQKRETEFARYLGQLLSTWDGLDM